MRLDSVIPPNPVSGILSSCPVNVRLSLSHWLLDAHCQRLPGIARTDGFPVTRNHRLDGHWRTMMKAIHAATAYGNAWQWLWQCLAVPGNVCPSPSMPVNADSCKFVQTEIFEYTRCQCVSMKLRRWRKRLPGNYHRNTAFIASSAWVTHMTGVLLLLVINICSYQCKCWGTP